MIVFACPNPACRKRYKVADDRAGKRTTCANPSCVMRIQVPHPPLKPAPVTGELIDEETGAVPKDWRDEQLPKEPRRHIREPEQEDPESAVCEDQVPRSKRVRGDEHDEKYDGEPRYRFHHRNRGFRCPYCGSTENPVFREKISAAGWVVFALLLVTTIILFWVGLLIKKSIVNAMNVE